MEDLVDACLAVFRAKNPYPICNVGSGVSVGVHDVAEKVASAFDYCGRIGWEKVEIEERRRETIWIVLEFGLWVGVSGHRDGIQTANGLSGFVEAL